MSTLDDRLREILRADRANELAIAETIAQIKQAFADEGWIKIPQIVEVEGKLETQHNFVDINNMRYMTGQEWYDRFERELQRVAFVDEYDVRNAVNQCWDAAMKAAGLDDKG